MKNEKVLKTDIVKNLRSKIKSCDSLCNDILSMPSDEVFKNDVIKVVRKNSFSWGSSIFNIIRDTH